MNQIKEQECHGWKSLQLKTDRITLEITPDIGGRIISLTLDDIETFFTLPELHGKKFELETPAHKKDLGWLHYGGYKTWLAPQDNWNDKLPFFDLDSGPYAYTIDQNAVILTSPICRETGMQFGRTISLSDSGQVHVDQTMTNHNSEEASWGIWDVTQIKGPGKVLMPLHHSSKFDKKVKGYDDEGLSTKNKESHLSFNEDIVILNCDQKENFKYGNDSDEGWICALLETDQDKWLGYLKTFETNLSTDYPHECVTEVFDSGSFPYFEVEVHSPLIKLKPKETFSMKETWTLDWFSKQSDYFSIKKWIRAKGENNE